MTVQVQGFDWDDGNRVKCQQHGVSIAEVEEVFASVVHTYPDPEHSHTETRFLTIGQTAKGRHVFLAFTFRDHGVKRLIRPISARYMHAKEVKHYEAQIAKPNE